MKLKRNSGVSLLEFTLTTAVWLPLILGTGVIGTALIRTQGTIQLARDTGHMYALGADFSKPANKAILKNLGADLGLSTTAGQGSAVVILSSLTYVDKPLCAAAGDTDSNGNPTSACTNLGWWVYTQRIVVGNSSLKSSMYGSPTAPVDPTTGKIKLDDYVENAGARVTKTNFGAMLPYSVITKNGTSSAQGLPSGEMVYIAEVAAKGFTMVQPFMTNSLTYSVTMF